MYSNIDSFNKTIYCIYKTTKKHACPICNQKVANWIFGDIVLYSENQKISICKKELLCFCKKCNMVLLDENIETRLKKTYSNFKPYIIKTDKSASLIELRLKIQYPVPEMSEIIPAELGKNGEIKKLYDFAIKNYKGQVNTPKKIISVPVSQRECPICIQQNIDKTLHDNWAFYIPLSGQLSLKISGKYCSKCENYFISEKDSDKVKRILKRYSAHSYTISDDLLPEKHYLQIFNTNKKHILLAKLNKCSDNSHVYLIITQDPHAANSDPNLAILYYKEEEARSLLAKIWHEKKTLIHLNKVDYQIKYKSVKEDLLTEIPEEIVIGKNGGYYSNNPDTENVDVLIYSPIYHTYEIFKATYNKQTKVYYMDWSNYKFISSRYGKPPIPVRFSKSYGSREMWAEQSELYCCGYNVREDNQLSTKERQKILADVIDLEIMEPAEIVNFLEFLIRTHSKHSEACYKWKTDINFVKNYKIDTKRFIIGKPAHGTGQS